jgi:peroxiredoxin
MNMKKVIFLLLTATILWSCQSTDYTIKGTVADAAAFEGFNVYLQETTDDGLQTLETAVIHNGTFTFKGTANVDVLHFITIGETDPVLRVPVLLEAGTIHVAFGERVSVTGTRINTLANELREEVQGLSSRARVIDMQMREKHAAGTLTEELTAKARAESTEITERIQSLNYRFARNNIGNPMGKFVLRTSISRFTPEQQEELLALADDEFRAEPNIAQLIRRLESARNVAIGKRFIDFTMQDPEGNSVSLSDFAGQGNYVLLSFWATWCAPCIAIIPHLREVYAQYKDRGFNIVGVSLDRDHQAWISGLERWDIPWTQMSDMKAWESPVVALYAFTGIPHSLLLDREGTIIARNLRGEALDKKLAELMP